MRAGLSRPRVIAAGVDAGADPDAPKLAARRCRAREGPPVGPGRSTGMARITAGLVLLFSGGDLGAGIHPLGCDRPAGTVAAPRRLVRIDRSVLPARARGDGRLVAAADRLVAADRARTARVALVLGPG